MNPALFSNMAINGFKAMGSDVKKTFTGGGKPLSYALRNQNTRARMDSIQMGAAGPRQYGPQDQVNAFEGLSGRRVAAAAGGAYVAGDVAHRAMTGGNATHDGRGAPNLLGVPFI